MNSSTTRTVWLEVDPTNKETSIADAINNWCASNANVQIESIVVYQEHITKYKAFYLYDISTSG